MVNRILQSLVLIGPLLLAANLAQGQAKAPAKPEVKIDLTDPQKALETYFKAQKANDLTALSKATVVTTPEKKAFVDVIVSYQMWARYLERQAIAKFGAEDGLRVEAHLRSLDDQTDRDLRRILDANVQYNVDKTTADVFLRVEKDRPDNLQSDRFQFLDVYAMKKTTAGWQVDFLKTYKCQDPDMEDNYKAEMGAFPRMARNVKLLAEQLKAGKFKTADDLKNALEAQWSHVFDEPLDANGRTAKEAEAAGAETQPAPTTQTAPK